ncbi:MAG: hypothetical protein WC629_00685 [Candidatus Paceibacterota bacterium]|jgi:multidrug transporter EmrE-like cation transporter
MLNLYLSLLGKVPVMGLILLAATSVVVGDFSAKMWSVNNKKEFLLLAFAGYFFSAFFYIPTLLRQGLIITSIVWGLLSTLGFIAIGLLIFKETLSISQTVAVVLGAVSLLILAIFE